MPLHKAVWTLDVDNYAPAITAITRPLLAVWARKIGAELRVISERRWPDMPPVYEKLQIHELGRDYDWNIYVDADAMVHPDFFDPTDHMTKDTVAHNGRDLAGNRWRYDKYFRRDGRHIGSCNWFTIASDWCLDLWRPLEDMSFAEAVSNIFPTVNERNTVIKPEHLIDDYVLSRNIARFGLKFMCLEDLLKQLGRSHGYLWHIYTVGVDEKLDQMRGVIKAWGLEQKKYNPPGIQGWMFQSELEWLHEKASEMQNVVEVGCWKGRSTHALLSGCKGTVFAVDHFEGSPSELETTHAAAKSEDIYSQFLGNVGSFANLHVRRMSSAAAATEFPDRSVDMVFIDAEHTTEACLADIRAWAPKTRRLLCGHDRGMPGVIKALSEAGIHWEAGPGSIWFSIVK